MPIISEYYSSFKSSQSPTFNSILAEWETRFKVKVLEYRLNFYKEEDWKPYHQGKKTAIGKRIIKVGDGY
jgi:hypothetical protein